MAFHPISAMHASQPERVLSADNARPDRFKVMDAMRRAAPALSLGPGILATLDALLSCLPPKRKHDIVFASNETLMKRRNGITDRTLRRHFAELIGAGLMTRISSPNGKRYSKCSSLEASVLCFGLDLAPLFTAFDKIISIAEAKDAEREQDAFLRSKLRQTIHASLSESGETETTAFAQRALRRTNNRDELQRLVTVLETNTPDGLIKADPQESASDRQNVRHQQNSEKELKKKRQEPITASSIVETCKEAASYLLEPITSAEDVIRHSHRLAPMMGMSDQIMQAAEKSKGRFGAALTLWIMMELKDRIRNPIGYFKSITSGPRSRAFCPIETFQRLAAQHAQKLIRCPRTMNGGIPLHL